MAGVLKSCLLCTLKTGCFLVAFYTFMLSALLLFFNGYDIMYAPEYLVWSRIVSFVFAVILFFAAICLLVGLFRNSASLLGVWLLVFLVYIVFQIAYVAWGIHFYSNVEAYDQIPLDIRTSAFVQIITFGILIFGNILALVAVHSEREHMAGKGMVLVPTSA